MYAKIVSGVVDRFPYTQSDLLQDNPNVSFPQNMSDAILESHGAHRVHILSEPKFDHRTQKIAKQDRPVFSDGRWVLGWDVLQKTAEEEAQSTALLTDNATRLRNELLQQSDWVVIVAQERGNPVPKAWTTYRQALRDITDQAGFPDNVIWPTKPD